jgi:hypothetical protein
MLHITHFVLIVSLAVGLVAITVSAQIYRRYRLGFLRAHLSIVISFNLMIFISIIALYIFNLPYGSVPDEVRTAAGMGHEYLIPLLQLLAAYFFLQVIWGMLDVVFDDSIYLHHALGDHEADRYGRRQEETGCS